MIEDLVITIEEEEIKTEKIEMKEEEFIEEVIGR